MFFSFYFKNLVWHEFPKCMLVCVCVFACERNARAEQKSNGCVFVPLVGALLRTGHTHFRWKDGTGKPKPSPLIMKGAFHRARWWSTETCREPPPLFFVCCAVEKFVYHFSSLSLSLCTQFCLIPGRIYVGHPRVRALPERRKTTRTSRKFARNKLVGKLWLFSLAKVCALHDGALKGRCKWAEQLYLYSFIIFACFERWLAVGRNGLQLVSGNDDDYSIVII